MAALSGLAPVSLSPVSQRLGVIRKRVFEMAALSGLAPVSLSPVSQRLGVIRKRVFERQLSTRVISLSVVVVLVIRKRVFERRLSQDWHRSLFVKYEGLTPG